LPISCWTILFSSDAAYIYILHMKEYKQRIQSKRIN